MSDDSDALRSNILRHPSARAEGPIGSGPLTPGGGGGDGIESRLAKLEAGQEHMDRSLTQMDNRLEKMSDALTRIEVALARLDERAASKGFVVTVVVSALALLAALSLFGPQIRSMVGLP